MIREDISKREFRKMVKETHGGYTYVKDGKFYKLDKDHAYNMYAKKRITTSYDEIKVDQIEWLSSLRWKVKHSYLPEGILTFEHTPIGIIYPHYFDGYSELLDCSSESTDVMLNNLRQAIINNLELTDNDIYNADFAGKNVLYKNSDVELIDLDGRHIKRSSYSNFTQVYSYFIPDLFRIFVDKLISQYGKEHTKELLTELRSAFPNPKNGFERLDPLETIDRVEKMRILK